jgi:endonuclease/exonuclease/phosphatase family metal-dependent hydrolase
MVRIASFNVENLFARPRAFASPDFDIGAPILAAYHRANELMARDNYDASDRLEMRQLLLTLEIYVRNQQGAIRRNTTQSPRWAWLRKNRGTFDRQPQDTTRDIEIVAPGRRGWIGWVELATEPTDETGVRTTARVIRDVGADILAIIEAEDRPSLVRFNEELLDGFYRHVMLVDGNDERGIDVGLMTRAGFPIRRIVSHVDTPDPVTGAALFSRDCAQFEVAIPGAAPLWVLVNHFKSQSGGGDTKRRRQAEEVRRLVNDLVAGGGRVVVLGDLNEGPAAAGSPAQNLEPLYNDNSPLRECFALNGFQPGARPGTFDNCSIRNRLDYIFVSQDLEGAVTGGGVFREGLWGGRVNRPTDWSTYPEMLESVHQASDHAAVFVDLSL